MVLMVCPECNGKVSDKAIACPACGYPMQSTLSRGTWVQTIGGVAGTYISTRAVVMIVVGVAMTIAFAAIMIALILGG